MNSKEHTFSDDTILVSKTDLKGNITYANQNFINISGYSETELIGKPHNIIRHPEMPAVIFKLLWDTLKSKNEIHAYAINRCKDNGYYWAFANVAPSLNISEKVVGYHSTRHSVNRSTLDIIVPLYKELLQVEKSSGIEASYKKLQSILNKKGMSYDEFILSI